MWYVWELDWHRLLCTVYSRRYLYKSTKSASHLIVQLLKSGFSLCGKIRHHMLNTLILISIYHLSPLKMCFPYKNDMLSKGCLTGIKSFTLLLSKHSRSGILKTIAFSPYVIVYAWLVTRRTLNEILSHTWKSLQTPHRGKSRIHRTVRQENKMIEITFEL